MTMEVKMNGKWLKVGMLAAVTALVGALALSTTAYAQGTTPQDGGGAGAGRRFGAGLRGAWGGPSNSLVTVAADVLGMEPADLVAILAEGQTIAEVAQAQGVAPDTIVNAAVAARAEVLNQAVADGRMTQAQADAMLANMKASLTAQLNVPHTPLGTGTGVPGSAFVDADGDGVCDNGATRQSTGPHGRWGR
jgi:hypothetical protein